MTTIIIKFVSRIVGAFFYFVIGFDVLSFRSFRIIISKM